MKNNLNKILWLAVASIILILGGSTTVEANTTTNVGAVNYAFYTSESTSLSVDMTPTFGEGGYHYYSLQSYFSSGPSSGLYAGIQTAGNDGQRQIGNTFIFSVWDATVAYPAEGVISTPFGGEGVGMSLRLAYDWTVGNTYTVNIQRRGFDEAGGGYRWAAIFHDQDQDRYIEMGEILAPGGSETLSNGHLFHERYSGTFPFCENSNPQLEEAGVIFSDLKSSAYINRSGVSSNGIFRSESCADYIHVQIDQNLPVASGFGIDQETYIKSWGGNPSQPPSTPQQPLPETTAPVQPPTSTVTNPDPPKDTNPSQPQNPNDPGPVVQSFPKSQPNETTNDDTLPQQAASDQTNDVDMNWIGFIGAGLAVIAAVLLGLIAHRNIKL